MTEIKNLEIEEARRALEEQLRPHDELTGDDFSADEERKAREEIDRLTTLEQPEGTNR